jgi:ComF family protein
MLLPPACAGCGKPGFRWCCECQQSVRRLPEPLCSICGVPIRSSDSVCAHCLRVRPAYRALRSWSVFAAPIRPALHHLKYRRDIGLGEALALQLAGFVKGLQWPVDGVTPVPLGRRRQRERGYNQASLIARPLSMAIGAEYVPSAVVRIRDTRTQVGLTRLARQENVRGAFGAAPDIVRGRVLLLVDDVATTGATLSACAQALLVSGARDVLALTVARAYPDGHHLGLQGTHAAQAGRSWEEAM